MKIEKGTWIEKGFMKYFSYEPTALVYNLLRQNTQNLKKSLNEIKQKNNKLNEDERNRTINKNKNHVINNMLSVINRIYQFFDYKFLPGKQPDEFKLLKWVKVNKKRFNQILSTVTKAKNEGLRIDVDRSEITLDNTESLLKDLGKGILDRHEFKGEYNNIVDHVKAIVNKPIITTKQE